MNDSGMILIREGALLPPDFALESEAFLPGWRVVRLDSAADVLFSNVDKHTVDGETPVRLCNYVDVYKNERITRDLDFMEASADERETRKFQIRRGDILAGLHYAHRRLRSRRPL